MQERLQQLGRLFKKHLALLQLHSIRLLLSTLLLARVTLRLLLLILRLLQVTQLAIQQLLLIILRLAQVIQLVKLRLLLIILLLVQVIQLAELLQLRILLRGLFQLTAVLAEVQLLHLIRVAQRVILRLVATRLIIKILQLGVGQISQDLPLLKQQLFRRQDLTLVLTLTGGLTLI